MAIPDLPILSMLRTRMQWHQERQRVLAENVANAETPRYRARDLAPPNFASTLQRVSISMARPIRAISKRSAVARISTTIETSATRRARAAPR